MAIQVIGPVAVTDSGRLGPRDRVVLQALALHHGRSVTADQLCDALWGDRPPPSAHKNLQSCVVRLRKALGTDAIKTTHSGYCLAVPRDHLDVWQFEAGVARARQLLELGEDDRVAFVAQQALDLWRGPPYEELLDWPPASKEAARLNELRLDAEELLLDAQLRRGRAREVLPMAHDMVQSSPLRERRWEQLALAQYRTGAQGEALRTIRQLRAILVNELGIDPGPDIVALEQSILRQDPSLLVPAWRPVTEHCPWQGLMAYDVDDADRFFGRDADVDACVAKVDESSFLALVGASGSGKSSLLRAGVLAALRRRGHRVVVVTPGRRPTQALSALPPHAPADTVLAIDQAEEAFALCPDPEERRAFLERLTEEAERRPVLLTVRGDRLGQATEHAGFSRLVERGVHLVGALDQIGLREAVERPAQLAGLTIEPGLVELLISEVRDDPGALPLLSHALLKTWERREGHTMTVDGYRASGGIHGAVAQSAEQLYQRLGREQQHRLRDLMLRLVSPGDDGEAVPTRVPRRLLGGDSTQATLIEDLVVARLVTSDGDLLCITHEALVRAWPRLRRWLEQDVEGHRIRHHLSVAADAWAGLGRPDSELYRGVRLTHALDWADANGPAITETERAFLLAGREAWEAEERSAATRARVQARMISRLRAALAGAFAMLLLAITGGAVALGQAHRANEQAAAARASEIRAIAQRAGASSLTTDRIDTALLLGVAASELDDSEQSLGELVAALSRQPSLVASVPLAGTIPRTIDLHPDGHLVATLDNHHMVRLVDVRSGREVAQRQAGPPQVEAEEVRPMRYSSDGELLAIARTSLRPRPVELLAGETLEPAPVQPGGLSGSRWQTIDLEFSRDSTRLVAVMNRMARDGEQWVVSATTAYVWDVAAPARPVASVDLTNPGDWASATLSPDGRLLYTLAPDLVVHHVASGHDRILAKEPTAAWGEVDLSPDGSLVAQARGDEEELVVRDSSTGRVRHRLRLAGQHAAPRFSADGRRLHVVTWHDRAVAVWDVASGRRVFDVQLAEGSSGAVDLDARGQRLVSAATEGALRTWDTTGTRRYVQRKALPALPWSQNGGACLTIPSPTGTSIAYLKCEYSPGGAWEISSMLFVDPVSGDAVVTPFPRGLELGLAGSWDPNGTQFAMVVGDAIEVWGHNGRVAQSRAEATAQDVQFTPGGDRLVVSGTDGRVGLVDVDTMRPVGDPVRLEGSAWAVAGPDDRHAFAVVGDSDTSSFWKNDTRGWALLNLAEGEILDRGNLDLGFVNHIAYSNDGRHAAVAAERGVQVFDLKAGEPTRDTPFAHPGGSGWVAFSPDGSRLVSSGFEGDVALWDVATATVTARVELGESVLSSAVFDAEGRLLIAPWWTDRAVHTWDPSRDRAIEFACRAAGRNLTNDEWRDHFGDLPYRTTCPP